jgi:pyruvate dehydrogenase E1 component alpha subunit
MPCEIVDGTDFFAVREAMQRALQHARGGQGPYALEIRCKRFLGHFVGDPQAYRTAEELAEARASDPIPRFRHAVTEAGLLDKVEFDEIEAAIQARIEAAVQAALAAPLPDPEHDLTKDVYVKYA